ncbi:MAG: tetratricopeptide repeat protein [Myxococcales bacterium]|nr:tetratricopeptide repeat protein [Myxococcales bacterium]
MTRTMVLLLGLGGCFGKSGSSPEAATSSAPQAMITDANQAPEDRIDEAARLIESGTTEDLDRAIFLLQSTVDDDTTGVARFNLGLAFQARGNLKRAANQYQAIIATRPGMGDAWLYLGLVQQQQGLLDAAVGNFRSGIRNDPEHMGLREALVAVLRKQGRVDEAILTAKEALKVNANSLAIYNNFALAYLDKDDTTRARFILQKALQSVEGAVNNAYLHTNLGWSYYLDGNIPAATESLEKAVQIDGELVPALVYLSRVYMDDRNYQDMVPLLETAEKNDPASADVQLNLGIAYRGLGRLDDAKAAYRKALSLDPANPTPHFNLGILLGDYEKDYDGAVAAFNQYIAAGGSEGERAAKYIEDVTREKERAERRARAEAERKRREEERARRQELLESAPEEDGSAPPSDAELGAGDGASEQETP